MFDLVCTQVGSDPTRVSGRDQSLVSGQIRTCYLFVLLYFDSRCNLENSHKGVGFDSVHTPEGVFVLLYGSQRGTHQG